MRRIVSTALFMAVCLSSMAQPQIKVLSGGKSTSTGSKINVICQTDPEARAWVNGKEVHVYKTGAFGDAVELSEGPNNVEIKVQKDNQKASKTISVTYNKPASSGSSSNASSGPQLKAEEGWIISKPGAYFQYGDGNDRLGGSKMGYLDSLVVLKKVGSIGDLYKVQLSAQRFAYVDKEYFDPSETKGSLTPVNTYNSRLRNDGKADIFSISLPKKLPYTSYTEFDPTVIRVNIYGAMNNSNWITQADSLGMIDYVDLVQIESDVLQAVIKLKKKYAWGYSIYYRNNTLTIKVRHTPSTSLAGMKIGLDAGHGGRQPGAVSITGLSENVVNLKLIELVKERLEALGAETVLTRTSTSQTLSMTERKKILSDAGVDLLVSIHNNSGGSPFEEHGTSTYYKYIVNRELASCLLGRMLELGVMNYGLVGNFNFSLCGPTDYPCALVEALFMNSLAEEEMLYDDDIRNAIADKVVRGLQDYMEKVAAEE